MASQNDSLRVDPALLQSFAQALLGATDALRNQLTELDGQVGEMLNGWRGASGSAYAAAWEQWHRGAAEVQAGLSMLAGSVARAGVGYRSNEAAAALTLRTVEDG